MSLRILLTVLALCTALAFASLGRWQWQRGVDKAALLQSWEAALVGHELPLSPALQNQSLLPQRVVGEGRFTGPYLLQDNQRHRGRIGLRYFRAMQVCCDEQTVLVDLGWRAWGETRQLPEPAELPQSAQVSGLLVPWPGQGIAMGDDAWNASSANEVLLLRIDRETISQRLGLELSGRLLRLDPQRDFGFERDLEALPNTLPPERHRGYAVQWFALALTVLIVYIVLSIRFHRRTSTSSKIENP
jgi:cytochrome oxidase assembly protein ShyY1